jgi:hypothetical protein
MSLPKEFYLPNALQAEEDFHFRLVLMGRPDTAGIVAKDGHTALGTRNDFGVKKKARKPAHTLRGSALRCVEFRKSVFCHVLPSL